MENTGKKKLYRLTVNKKLFGVCGGIANYFGIDPGVVRLIWALAVIFAGVGILAYIVCALVIPNPPAGYAEYINENGRFNALHKSSTDRKICGVCGGIAESLGVDSTVIRVLWLVLTLFAGYGVIAYIIAAIAMN